ncbi:hypothetical protein KC340_g11487 [Hortaea werneckii]|nr:hypothetical protein KC342_g16208 [Hortaea werneckii]KAI7081426.1 hypothetical protein KC339_g13333 [Hortaea werneckii]KAI7213211.1 hypothetical protein KC365_g14341 [Hortaea werneckii]KAI7307267.1 hypothetical protein KC340_g11487 [Hortaea werneckii]KAI7389306.1 hypothetical protein KC328_g8510 [Hortaea werneckii]
MSPSQERDGMEQRSVSETDRGHLGSVSGHVSSNSASDIVPSLVEDCTGDDATSNRNTTETPSDVSSTQSDTSGNQARPTNAARPEGGLARMLKLHNMLSETEGHDALNRWLGDTSDPWNPLEAYCPETQARRAANIEGLLAHVDRLFPSQRMK